MNRSTEEVLSFDEAMEKYDPVLGFEVHVELNTRTKMFDAAPNVFGDEPNTNVTPVSLGLPATFLFGGLKRSDPARRVALRHGDVAVWGGPSRLAYHGINPLAEGCHPALGRQRLNLTFRRAL